MEHPAAARFRNQLAAISRGDVAPFYEDTREDFVNFNDIGAGPWRENHGRDAFFATFLPVFLSAHRSSVSVTCEIGALLGMRP